ncbi:MAG: dethiobiotin synthase [Bradymonadia bacterium]
MKQTYLVVGSDTDVGKTYVSCGLLQSCRRLKRPVLAIKPIESGSEILTPETEDGYRLAQASGQSTPERALIRLKHPVAPPLAAERESVSIDWMHLVNMLDSYIDTSERVLIEGAGGLLSPLTWTHSAVDLALALDAALIVVVLDKLGAVHQARTCLALARLHRLRVAALILNAGSAPDETSGQNRDSLMKCPEWISGEAPPIFNVQSDEVETTFDGIVKAIY